MTWTLLLSLLVKSSVVAGAGLACARTLKTRIAHIMTHTASRRRPVTVALSVVALADRKSVV